MVMPNGGTTRAHFKLFESLFYQIFKISFFFWHSPARFKMHISFAGPAEWKNHLSFPVWPVPLEKTSLICRPWPVETTIATS